MTYFDSDSTTVVYDNSANVHICKDTRHYVGKIALVSTQKIATIGGRGHAPAGVGTVCWILSDDSVAKHRYLVENVLYFLQSLINILSVTEFARQFNDNEGTGVDTQQISSKFYLDNYKYSHTICQSQSDLPERQIN